MKSYKRYADIAVEPITTSQAKAHLRVDHSVDNTLIGNLITAARNVVEETTWRALKTQTWDMTLDAFPSEIILPRPPLQSVSYIKYTDTAGATQTLSTSIYTVDTTSEPGRVYLSYDQDWPDTLSQPQSVRIRFVAGYATGAAPDAMLSAMYLMIGHLYENREAVVTGTMPVQVPMSVDYILSPYRARVF